MRLKETGTVSEVLLEEQSDTGILESNKMLLNKIKYDPAIPLLCINPKGMLIHSQKRLSMAVLFVGRRSWTEFCASVTGCIDE